MKHLSSLTLGLAALLVLHCVEEPVEPQAGSDTPLSIVWTNPKANTSGAAARTTYDEPYDVAIEFSHSMDPQATSSAVTVYEGDSLVDSVAKHWHGGRVLELSFANHDFDYATQYTVIVDAGALDVDSSSLEKADTIRFTPEPFLRITSLSVGTREILATHGEWPDTLALSGGVGVRETAVLKFNAGLDASVPDSLFLVASVPCSGWISGTRLMMRFDDSLVARSEQSFTVTSALRQKDGDTLPQAKVFTVGATPLYLQTLRYWGDAPWYRTYDAPRTSISIGDTVRVGAEGETLYLHFSRPLDMTDAAVPSLIFFRPACDYTASVTPQPSQLVTLSQVLLHPATSYEMVFSPSITGMYGLTLGDSLKVRFTTEPFVFTGGVIFNLYVPEDTRRPEQLMVAIPANAYASGSFAQADRADNYLIATKTAGLSHGPVRLTHQRFDGNLSFNALLDASSLTGNIGLTPADSGFAYKANREKLLFTSTACLTPETQYHMVIDSAVKDTFGNALGLPIEFEFTTEPFGLMDIRYYTEDSVRLTDSVFVKATRQPTDLETISEFFFNCLLDAATVGANVSVTPLLSYQIVVDGNVIRLWSDTLMIPDTTYSVVLASGIQESHGVPLKHHRRYTFGTEPFKVHNFFDYNALSAGLVSLRFNSRVVRDSLMQHLTVSPLAKYQALALKDTSEVASVFHFDCDSIPALGEWIGVSVDSLLTDIHGKRLVGGFDTTFQVVTQKY